jgi:hypothetical protein
MKIIPYSKLLIIPAFALLNSCGSGGEDAETNGNDTAKTVVNDEQRINTQNVFFNIPSPVETSALLLEVGAEYDIEYVNNPASSVYKAYINEESRAMNLGVYGADLSFSGIFENTQESMSFLGAVNSLCKDLGIAGVFDEKTAERLEKNKDDRDSILDIVSKSFWEADAFLKENQRPNTSSLIVAGGWVEGMNIAVKVYKKTKHGKLRNRIISPPQRSSLNSLIALLESVKQSSESQFLLDGLRDLKKIYDKIPEGNPVTTFKTDSISHVTTIETKNNVQVDDAIMNEIIASVEATRAKIVTAK